MKIKVTAGELSVMAKPLQDLVATKMPAGIGYRVARLIQKLEIEINLVFAKQGEIMRKYKATEADDELTMTATNPNFPKVKAELGNLFAQEIEVDVDIVTLPKKVELEPATLLILDKFIKVS